MKNNLRPDVHIGYRPDVDGLRAVAILAVIFFHAFPKLIRGGFVGVDVFFVISGFLITQIIVTSLERGTFRFGTFYYRRARRLLPALALVMVATVIAAPLFLFSSEIVSLGKHIISSVLFSLNIRLVHEAGYFDASANSKPLLNLWSLGVEEQFYLFWPFLIAALYVSKARLRKGIILLGVISFILNIIYFKKYSVPTFYLPHTRLWEMTCGAVIATLPPQHLDGIHLRARSRLSIFGFYLILLASIACNDQGYPGWQGLLPVVGTSLIILAGEHAWINRQILQRPSLIFIGFISYPLYLWHWPILAFCQIINFGRASVFARLAALAASFVFAAATFYGLELPVRKKPKIATARQLGFVFALLLIMGLATQKLGGRINKLPESLSQHSYLEKGLVNKKCLLSADVRSADDVEFCNSDRREKPRLAVWGDSKANAIYAGLVTESMPGARWMLIGRSSCAPVMDLERAPYNGDTGEACSRENQIALQTLTTHAEIKTVLLAVASRILFKPSYHAPGHPEVLGSSADGVIASLKTLLNAGKRVGFLVDNPTLSDPESCVPRPFTGQIDPRAECVISLVAFRERTAKLTALVERIQKELPAVVIIDATDLLCDHGLCRISEQGHFLYGFTDHLSDEGARKVARRIVKALGD